MGVAPSPAPVPLPPVPMSTGVPGAGVTPPPPPPPKIAANWSAVDWVGGGDGGYVYPAMGGVGARTPCAR
jgi:hypothetical protein